MISFLGSDPGAEARSSMERRDRSDAGAPSRCSYFGFNAGEHREPAEDASFCRERVPMLLTWCSTFVLTIYVSRCIQQPGWNGKLCPGGHESETASGSNGSGNAIRSAIGPVFNHIWPLGRPENHE